MQSPAPPHEAKPATLSACRSISVRRVVVQKMAQVEHQRAGRAMVLEKLERVFTAWLSKQSLVVEVAIVTATNAVLGAAIGAVLGTIANDCSSSAKWPLPDFILSAFSGGPFIQGREFAVMAGVYSGISCVMKRLRGKEDVQTCMVASFGCGAIRPSLTYIYPEYPVLYSATSGLVFALLQGGHFKLTQMLSQSPREDAYARTRNMLTGLGLENYDKNFRKGLLTDDTLPLLTDSALRDVKIPPGPRLLILDHIERDPEIKSRKKM